MEAASLEKLAGSSTVVRLARGDARVQDLTVR
jgi:hypothetical protein